MASLNEKELNERVVALSQHALAEKGSVTAIDILLGLGWLSPENLEEWQRGRALFLESVVLANLSKISRAMKAFHAWSAQQNLVVSEEVYAYKGRPLRFSKFAIPAIEAAYRRSYTQSASH